MGLSYDLEMIFDPISNCDYLRLSIINNCTDYCKLLDDIDMTINNIISVFTNVKSYFVAVTGTSIA